MKFETDLSLTFDDVLIKPQFSEIKSRKDVDVASPRILGNNNPMKLPVFSANMDTITDVAMCHAMAAAGGMGVLHRFFSIEENVKAFKQTKAAVSVGLGDIELERAIQLKQAGAKYFFIDVAHGASQEVADRAFYLKKELGVEWLCVGNFASGSSLEVFLSKIHMQYQPNAIKVGVGPGSACTTRIKTGIGVPQLSAIYQCANATWLPIIADGGLRTPGDIAKALGAGAKAVMVGGMLAGTDETPGPVLGGKVIKQMEYGPVSIDTGPQYKQYRGSASKESYADQGKDASWRTAEGESFTVSYKGPVAAILQDIEGGLRSSFAYVGAKTLSEFQERVVFQQISSSTLKENGAHGKK